MEEVQDRFDFGVRYPTYSCNTNDSCRYVLGFEGSPKMLSIGLNPSVASAYVPDPTVLKTERVVRKFGYRGFTMLNLYPGRSTDFSLLPEEPDPGEYERNITEIVRIFGQNPDAEVWAAWGVSILARRYFLRAAREILEASLEFRDLKWVHYGDLTANGHPKHASRLCYEWGFSSFYTKEYLKLLEKLVDR